MRIQETDEGYEVTDHTSGEHLQRNEYAQYDWRTVWSKDLELIGLFLNRKSVLDVYTNKIKGDWDYNRIVRARNRHLSSLKLHLRLIEPKDPEPKELIIYEGYWGFGVKPIEVAELGVKPKTFSNGMKKDSCMWVKATEEKIQLVNEYNQKLAEFKKYQKSMRLKIFGEKPR